MRKKSKNSIFVCRFAAKEEKTPYGHFFNLIACAAGAQEDRSRPSCESPRPDGHPLDSPFRGLGLEASDRQRFARIQTVRKGQCLSKAA